MTNLLFELAPVGLGVGLGMIVIGVLKLKLDRMFEEDDDE